MTLIDLPDSYAEEISPGTVAAYINTAYYGSFATYQIARKNLIRHLDSKLHHPYTLTSDPMYTLKPSATGYTVMLSASITTPALYAVTAETAHAEADRQKQADMDGHAAQRLYRGSSTDAAEYRQRKAEQEEQLHAAIERIADKNSIAYIHITPQPDPHKQQISDLLQRITQ